MTDLTLPIRIDPDSAPDDTLHVTASGLPVRIYATDGSEPTPIHGAIYIDGSWEPRSWLAGGKYERSGAAHAFDLRDRPKRGWWVAWFEGAEGTPVFVRYATKAEAMSDQPIWATLRGVSYIAEGDGLDTPADPPLWVDWAELPDWAKWAAADEEGCVWGYDKKPEEGDDAWCIRSNYRCIEIKSPPLYRLAPGFDWRETLTQRPEGK